jgi:Gamma-butyrobetaine hydroxylase-like, N-terminal
MSHEGIRFISEEEAARLAQETSHRDLSREATEPARVRVQKTTGTGMEIDWKDGHQSRWNFTWLRDACPCATCHEERGATGRKPGEPKPKPPTLLQMYKAPARDYLRRHCVCDVCRAAG